MTSKILKVNCSFCEKEMDCPENMLNAKHHMCPECFENPPESTKRIKGGQLHIDSRVNALDDMMAKGVVAEVMETAFPHTWKDMKQEKGLSKKEVAEGMFAAGAYAALQMVVREGRTPIGSGNRQSRA